MQFIHSPLTWAFFLVLAPLLIHLINMMRHRRVKWAAMEFLLQSYRRHRTWVWLKQLILLLMRMAAIAAVVAMLAQLVTPDRWSALFGGKVTHHYVLLDDSYSMSDQAGSVRAYDRATEVVRRIGQRAALQDSQQRFTLIRFSRAAGMASGDVNPEKMARIADMNGEAVHANFEVRFEDMQNRATTGSDIDEYLESKRRDFDVTQLSVGPQAALDVVSQLLGDAIDENRVIYVVSDFRGREWENPAELGNTMKQLQSNGTELYMVDCVQAERPNLGITDIMPADGTQAAGVPLFVNVKVKNHGSQAVRNVQLKVRSLYYDAEIQANIEPVELEAKVDEPPTILIENIGPGETVLRQMQVYFPSDGQHVVEASLPDDPIPADNRRWCVVDFPSGVPVLLVDGDSRQRNAYFLESVFQPGGRVRTGLQPEIQDIAFLRDTPKEQLHRYHAIYLLDIDRLDQRAVDNVREYVEGGGGLCVFMGPNSSVDFWNGLYEDGEGLFPVELDRHDLLTPDIDSNVPDFRVVSHPAFRIFFGDRNPFLAGITIEEYFRAEKDWAPDPQSTIKVVAKLRNNQPLIVERRLGEGSVIAALTTLTPEWNNWAMNPSFVVVLLDLQSHLAAPRRVAVPRMVGAPIDVAYDSLAFKPDVNFVTPSRNSRVRNQIEKQADLPKGDSKLITTSLGTAGPESGRTGETDTSGVYESWAYSSDGIVRVDRYALNVDPSEGDLSLVDARQLADKLDGIQFQYRTSDAFQYEISNQAGANWSEMILIVLIVLLLLEQAMAYSASYHTAKGGAR